MPTTTGVCVREEVEVALHEHRFLVTKLLESLHTASLYVSPPLRFRVSACFSMPQSLRFCLLNMREMLRNCCYRPPSTITVTRLRTVNETFRKVLEKDRDLLAAVKKRAFEQTPLRSACALGVDPNLTYIGITLSVVGSVVSRHQVAQKELLRVEGQIQSKKQKVVQYAAQLPNVLRKHRVVLQNAKQKPKAPVVLDPRDIVAYAHRIAGTTSAPKEWQPGVRLPLLSAVTLSPPQLCNQLTFCAYFHIQFPMFGFMPPAPQEHMMRAGVLSRGIVAEIVTQGPEKYTSTAARVKQEGEGGEALEKLNIPIGLGASDAQIRKQMPPGWKPGDPVDLPLDALLHYMGRSFFTEHGITLPEAWKAGDPLPPDAMEILRKKFKLPEKRAPLYDDEVVDDVASLRKKRKLEDDSGDGKTEDAESSSSSESSDSDEEAPNAISLSLSSSSEDDSGDDSD
ncbi:hypothetical protein BBJ28_00009215 [Nothophytophthora sp. Chile5]|nr:hypothetical protein BBJ28_00009215 [Nothophytophthora sp. Chile5]